MVEWMSKRLLVTIYLLQDVERLRAMTINSELVTKRAQANEKLIIDLQAYRGIVYRRMTDNEMKTTEWKSQKSGSLDDTLPH